MKQNRLGSSDIFVSEIGFGCMSLRPGERSSQTILERAAELGVTFFDTADLYDQGQNEVLVGKALKPYRENVVLASKVGNRWHEDGQSWFWDPSPSWIKEALGHTLKRLQTDYLDLYQLHGGTLDDPIDDIIKTFEELKQQGFIRAYGISSIRPNVIREWLKRSNIVSNMMQYSLLDRRPEEAALGHLRDANVSVIARGPVAKGLLADKPAKGYLEHSVDEVKNVQAELADFTNAKRSRAQLALRYALAHPPVATVIPGASTLEQLEENVGAAESPPLNQGDLKALQVLSKANLYDKHR